jgi:hypothetical protein
MRVLQVECGKNRGYSCAGCTHKIRAIKESLAAGHTRSEKKKKKPCYRYQQHKPRTGGSPLPEMRRSEMIFDQKSVVLFGGMASARFVHGPRSFTTLLLVLVLLLSRSAGALGRGQRCLLANSESESPRPP